MRNLILFLLIIVSVVLNSCSEGMNVWVRFLNIDSKDNDLQLYFNFKRWNDKDLVHVSRIHIYKNDTLTYSIENQVNPKGISDWTFPSIPQGFKITFPEKAEKLSGIGKNDNIRFSFSGGGKFIALGHWDYKPKYNEPSYRWLFDEYGNYKVNINCYFINRIGKDLITIASTEAFEVMDKNAISLTDIQGNALDFELKFEQNPTKTFALILQKPIKANSKMKLSFYLDIDKKYETIVISDKSSIALY